MGFFIGVFMEGNVCIFGDSITWGASDKEMGAL